jgi:arsenate reductase (glutaredoxin)
MITIYHNPRCGKSRECLAFIQNSNLEFEVIKYLETPFTESQLKAILKKLNYKPIELVRIKESIWVNQFKGKQLSDDEIIKAMVNNPILIERPIAAKGSKAVIARPLEKIKELV